MQVRRVLLATLCGAAFSASGLGQATPSATETSGTGAAADTIISGPQGANANTVTPYGQFNLPDMAGSLRYALTASESVVFGYNGSTGNGAHAYTNFSGDLAYLSRSVYHPFSAVYAGGYFVGTSTFPSYTYHSLSLSQGFRTPNWNFVFGDQVSYLPQTPIGSLSGVPGAGDQTLNAVSLSSTPTLGILTTYATRISNTVSGTATRLFTAKTSASLTGSYGLQHYTGSSTNFQGLDNSLTSASLSVQHQLSELTSFGGQYSFTDANFTASPLLGLPATGYQTHSVQAFVTHQISARTLVSASVGPQWVVGDANNPYVTGANVSVAASATISYNTLRNTYGLSYTRGVNNGNGVTVGSRLDSVVGSFNHPFHRRYDVGAIVGYNHSQQLGSAQFAYFDTNGVVAGAQFSAQVATPVSVFTGYTLQRQLFTGNAPSGIQLNGLTQYVSVGVTFAPKPLFGRK